jgi:hypothetical protein
MRVSPLQGEDIFGSSLFPVGRHSFATHSVASIPLPARLDWHRIRRPSGMMAEESVARE